MHLLRFLNDDGGANLEELIFKTIQDTLRDKPTSQILNIQKDNPIL